VPHTVRLHQMTIPCRTRCGYYNRCRSLTHGATPVLSRWQENERHGIIYMKRNEGRRLFPRSVRVYIVSSMLHIGIYGIPEAARLTGLGESRVRRWLSGYTYTASGTKKSAPPVWPGQLPPIKGRRAVSFRDLVEMKFVDAFLRAGVSWKTIRRAQELARKELGFDHPFTTNRFRTDGSHIVVTALRHEEQTPLFDLATRQQIFLQAADPFREELEMNEHDQVCRWWPMGRQRYIVLDPTRQWGRPLLARSGVPAALVVRLNRRGLSAEQICRWYEVQAEETADALAFAQRLGGL